MNEQIKKLAVKAGFPEWSHKTVGFELEQFAQLLIQECVNIAMREDHGPAECIKKHFEVNK